MIWALCKACGRVQDFQVTTCDLCLARDIAFYTKYPYGEIPHYDQQDWDGLHDYDRHQLWPSGKSL